MANKNKRQTKCKSDDDQKKKNTKGGVSSLAASSPVARISHRRDTSTRVQIQGQQPNGHYLKQVPAPSVYIKKPHIVHPVRSPYLQRPSVRAAQRPNTHNPQQKKILQNGLNQLQEYFHGLVLERMLVCNKTCNEDGRPPPVEILSTSCDGQQPPGGGKNVVILDYECFEENKLNRTPNDNDRCCKPPIQPNCKKLINLIKKLLKEILTEFFKSASSPEMLKFDISKVAKACVVSYFIETINALLINTSSPSASLNIATQQNNNTKDIVQFYIKVSVQAITGGKVKTARDFLVHVNVNSLKTLFDVPNINALTSNIIKEELKKFPTIVDEIKSVMLEVQQKQLEYNKSPNTTF